MAVKYYNDGTDFRLPGKGRTAEWVRRCVGNEGLRLGPVNFVFCSPERHLEINRGFLGHNYATDVITFDYSDGNVVGGDIFIDPATVADNAALYLAAPEKEMRRVLIHGVLHLCGYGDKTPREQKQMRAKEDFYLATYYETV
jgi:rRNA maturation RNase YbeY